MDQDNKKPYKEEGTRKNGMHQQESSKEKRIVGGTAATSVVHNGTSGEAKTRSEGADAIIRPPAEDKKFPALGGNAPIVSGYADQVNAAGSLKAQWNESAELSSAEARSSAPVRDSHSNTLSQQVNAAKSIKDRWADTAAESIDELATTTEGDTSTKTPAGEEDVHKPKANTEETHRLANEQALKGKDDVPTAEKVDEDAEKRRIEAEIAQARAEGHRQAMGPTDVVAVVIVEPKELEFEQQPPKKKRLVFRFMIAAFAVVVAVVVVVVVVVLSQNDSGGSSMGGTSSVQSHNNSTNRTAGAPPPGTYKCFHNLTELQEAIDLWVASKDNFKAAAVYGPDIRFWCVSKIQAFEYLFSAVRNPALANFDADLSGWDMSNATSLAFMFAGARNFNGIGLDRWSTPSVTNLAGMFQSADLFNVDLSKWDVSKVVSMDSMFESAGSFRGLGLDSWRQRNCRSMSRMLRAASSFDTNVVNWDVSNVVRMDYLFSEATRFLGNGLSAWNVGKVQNFTFMFNNGGLTFDFDASSWDVSNAVYLKNMFSSAQGFQGKGLAKWNVSKVTDMSFMFNSAFAMNADLSSWDVRNVKTLVQMFSSDKSFNRNLCSWGSKLTASCNTANMFDETACPQTRSPSLTTFPPGPFCQDC